MEDNKDTLLGQIMAARQPKLTYASGKVTFAVPTDDEYERLAQVVKSLPRATVDNYHDTSDGFMLFNVPVTRRNAFQIIGVAHTFDIDLPELVLREMAQISKSSARSVTEYDSLLHIEWPDEDSKTWDIKNELNNVPNRRHVGAYEGGQVAMEFPFSGEQCDMIEPVIVKYKFDVSADLFQRIVAMGMSWRKTLEMSTQVYSEMDVDGLGGKLLPYQKVAVAYGLLTERFILADVQCLGKTVETIALLKAALTEEASKKALIICPAIAKHVWETHFAKWLPDWTCAALTPQHPTWAWALFNVVIISYDALQNQTIQEGVAVMKAAGLSAVIMDESQFIKSMTAQRTKKVLDIVAGVRYRVAVTGTPVMNQPDELVAQLEAIGRLDDFGGRAWFNSQWGKYGLDLDSYEARRLNKRLRQMCMIRRTREDVAEDLRNLSAGKLPRQTVYVDMDASYQREYMKALHALLDWIAEQADKAFSEDHSFTETTENERGEYIEERKTRAKRGEALVRLNALRLIIGKAKIRPALDYINQFHRDNPGKKLVVFAEHKEVLLALATELDGVMITGDTSETRRIKAIDEFQNDPSVENAFVSIAAAGMAITLTAAHHELFVEQTWSAGKLSQAEARCDRIGQKSPVEVAYLVAEAGITNSDTEIDIDPQMFDLITRKFDLMQNITDGEGGAEQSGSVLDEMLKKLNEKAMNAAKAKARAAVN